MQSFGCLLVSYCQAIYLYMSLHRLYGVWSTSLRRSGPSQQHYSTLRNIIQNQLVFTYIPTHIGMTQAYPVRGLFHP